MQFEIIEPIMKADYSLKWRMFETCNLNCSYCNRSFANQKEKLPELKTLIEKSKKINTAIENKKKFCQLILIGGEPTLTDINKINKEFTSKYIKIITIVTNFTADKKIYEEFINFRRSIGSDANIVASLHENINIENFINKFSSLNCKGSVEFVITEENINDVKKIKSLCEKKNINYSFDLNKLGDIEKISKLVSFEKIKKEAQYVIDNEIYINHRDLENILTTKKLYCIKRAFILSNDVLKNCTVKEPIGDINNLNLNIQFNTCDKEKCAMCGKEFLTKNAKLAYSYYKKWK